MKRRSLSGNFAIFFFLITFICIVVAFCTASWLVSDYRITGAKLDRFGLWSHCFRSLEDPYNRYERFFVGCRWIFDPFTKGYDEIKGYTIPDFMVATQLFFTLAFMGVGLCGILVLLYFLCCGPDQSRFTLLIKVIGLILMGCGVCSGIAVVVFALTANRDGWMPGYENNWFGYSFILAAVGAIGCFVSGTLFLVEEHVQTRKQRQFRESQSRFELEHESKA